VDIELVAVKAREAGSNNSADDVAVGNPATKAFSPPIRSTFPLDSSTELNAARGEFMVAETAVKLFAIGS